MKPTFHDYLRFVDEVTSSESKDLDALIARLKELEKEDENAPRIITAGLGIGSEGGEVAEIVKKVIFQGKPLDSDTKFHIKRELGDILWYVAQMCLALDYDMEEVMMENINKLQSRYPGGFSVENSENRKSGDL